MSFLCSLNKSILNKHSILFIAIERVSISTGFKFNNFRNIKTKLQNNWQSKWVQYRKQCQWIFGPLILSFLLYVGLYDRRIIQDERPEWKTSEVYHKHRFSTKMSIWRLSKLCSLLVKAYWINDSFCYLIYLTKHWQIREVVESWENKLL